MGVADGVDAALALQAGVVRSSSSPQRAARALVEARDMSGIFQRRSARLQTAAVDGGSERAKVHKEHASSAHSVHVSAFEENESR